ncbi:hypothetical protein BKA67DRAFT_564634 [Truncatella angustata]|uniref:ribonuclease Z n=1 Tax=Truncatella angustata TaxID=152316 RepID=A0A9P8ULQ0_9PEZI|nr:uncharacterized protein BKA67DRAFT_564634 [Truncatella angustata]KAH6654285.1 hypothetical protein BKA67DRAFT_564634 [Truncatella angustata]KAH8203415.1 hypothetical protein TruAng_002399 [Truncatella angustata]
MQPRLNIKNVSRAPIAKSEQLEKLRAHPRPRPGPRPRSRPAAPTSRYTPRSVLSNTKLPFEGAVVPPKLFYAEKGTTLRILPVPSGSRILWRTLGTPRFFIFSQDSRVQKKPDLTAEETAGRVFGTRMLSHVQLVTTPTADTQGTCLMLHFDNQRYVFGNISEGTQRAIVQRKLALNKTEDIFMSGLVNWHNAGGLIGLILTLSDVISTQKDAVRAVNAERKKKGTKPLDEGAISNLRIHGGKNLAQLLATSRRFVFRKGLPLQPHEVRHDPRVASNSQNEPDWKDTNINVWYMPVEANSNKPVSSRKRSHEEMTLDEPSSNSAPPKTSKEDDQKKVTEIVSQMFNSNWNLDALTETTLYQAKLPAKLFVRNEKGHIQQYKGPLPGEGENVPNIPVLVRRPWPAAMHLTLPGTEPSKQSLCYIVKSHDRRGKFQVKEAQKYAIEKSDYRKLTAGETVTAKDGVVVTPDMVLGETVLGEGFAVLDVPDLSYVEPLINRPEFSNGEIMRGINAAFWILGPGVVHDVRLQAFMQKTTAMRHIICSGDCSPNMLALESAAVQTFKLHQIDPQRFPMPYHSNIESLSKSAVASLPSPLETGRTGKMIQFSPQFLHQDDKIVAFPDVEALAVNGQAPIPELKPLSQQAREKCKDADFLAKIEEVESDIPNRDAEVITLGTGSALPSKYRNVSATLVRVPGYGNYLFDAGENTMGQLRRVFGDELPSIMRDLKVIWISHLHADHHLGTAGVIKAWADETSKSNPAATLHVASHVHMIDWLREYAEIENYGYDRLTFTSFSAYQKTSKICISPPLSPAYKKAYGLEKIDATYVAHCHGALATVFTWPSGLKIAYSGDCRPSDDFVKIGQGTTLLIHESTFDDELKGDALAKKHSTMSEAIDVGRRMGARRIMLTHFSQRYQKVPALDDSLDIKAVGVVDAKEKAKLDEVILVAFDYMRVKLGEFRHAQAFLPAIQKLFEDVSDQ